MTKKRFQNKINMETLVETTFRRLLKEYTLTPEEEAEIKHSQHVRTLMPLAAFIMDLGTEKTAILYSPDDVNQLIRTYRDAEIKRREDYRFYFKKIQLSKMSIDGAIRGLIQIREPRNPCWGAWEVIGSAAPGGPDIARTVYGLGYAMSPSGILISDRRSVSRLAKDAWARVEKKRERRVLPLDDVDAHNPDGTIRYDHPNHTEDPGDDCKLYRGKSWSADPSENPQLQNAYVATGKEKSMMDFLTAAHESFMDELAAEDPELPKVLETYLKNSIHEFFRHHYPGPDND